MQYAIITGASRGLGEAIAKQLIYKQVNVVSVARSDNEDLNSLAEEQGIKYLHVNCDLSKTEEIEKGLAQIKEEVFHEDTHYVYLVNNAGIIEPIETVGQFEGGAVEKHFQVNVTAPILMTNGCLQEANKRKVPMGIINITSGAAEKTIHGWSTYSSAKAAINKFTETLAFEQEGSNHLILAYSPGVIDTDMQGEIRSSSKDAFADVDKFKQLKEEGALRSPEEVASVLMKLLSEPQKIENGKVYKLYDLIEE